MMLELILPSRTSLQILCTERFAPNYCNHNFFPHNFHLVRHFEVYPGAATRDDIVSHLNNIGNAMNMEQNPHTSYDKLK